MSDLLLVEDRHQVRTITLNRPEKLNAFIEPMREELASALTELADREDINVCCITGSGRGFCAGGDIAVMNELIATRQYDQIQTFLKWGKQIVTTIRSLPIPVIAAVNGPAAGAGMNLALACDYRIASNHATFGQTFVNIGLNPDWGGTYYLPRLVGPSRTLDMFWRGRVIDATEAHRWGVVDLVVAHEDFYKEAQLLLSDLTSRPRNVLSFSKKGVYDALSSDLEDILDFEARTQDECIRSDAAREGMKRFLEARAKKAPEK